MAIRVVCACGKRLKVRGELAGRVTLCPACGEHVPIPTAEATPRGAARSRNRDRVPQDGSERRSQLPEILVRGQRQTAVARHREQPETGWIATFVYTLPVLPWLALLAAALTVTSGYLLSRLPDFLQSASRHPLQFEVFVPCALAVAVLLLCTTPLLSGVLALGIEGSLKIVSRPTFDDLLRAAAQWIACLAAGPALILVAAAVFWIHCGDPEPIDWIILLELFALASALLLAALVTTSPSGGFRRLHPAGLIESLSLLGWRFAGSSVVIGAALLGMCGFVAFAVSRMRAEPIEGALWLGLGWFTALSLAAFFFRRLGLRYYRAAHANSSSTTRARVTTASVRLSSRPRC